ncbi:protein FAM219B isoform X1 [Piliocolobus tephrosceles]|uniref:protein FAM219B isoform X1 n=1 Tax=Piliocolobus tephrosceles TaxID=591936 RepID=UPI000C2A6974|nr:protein FAM219B isoform X1 [Piliocolobus tephrosceles]
MATAEPSGRAVLLSTPGPRPSGARDRAPGAVGPPSGQISNRALRLGERIPAAVEKRGPYMVTRAPSIQAKLQKHRDLAKAVLRRKGMLGASPNRPDSSGKRSVKFNKGYTALSQSPDENLVSLDSDSDGELESRYSSGYSSAEASPEHFSAQGQAAGSITTTAKCLFGAHCQHSTVPDFWSVLQSSTLPSSPSGAGEPGCEPAAASGWVSPR